MKFSGKRVLAKVGRTKKINIKVKLSDNALRFIHTGFKCEICMYCHIY